MIRRLIVFAVLSLAGLRTASATYLRLVPMYQLQMDSKKQTLTIEWSIGNQGDESAHDVGLDFPTLNQAYPVASVLEAGRGVPLKLTFPLAQLGIGPRGVYSVIFRVTYKDANLYPFSAPYLIRISRPPEMSRVLLMRLNLTGQELSLALNRPKTVSVGIMNISNKPMSLESVDPLSAVELPLSVENSPAPGILRAGEERDFQLKMLPAQTLIGSLYLMGVVVSGSVDGVHFSEPLTFFGRIHGSLLNARSILLGLLLLIALGTLAPTLYRRMIRKKGPGSAIAARKSTK